MRTYVCKRAYKLFTFIVFACTFCVYTNRECTYLPKRCVNVYLSTFIGFTFANHCSLSGQSYKATTIVNYDSRVLPDLKIPHITTLEL